MLADNIIDYIPDYLIDKKTFNIHLVCIDYHVVGRF
jgi:hypothetical protein